MKKLLTTTATHTHYNQQLRHQFVTVCKSHLRHSTIMAVRQSLLRHDSGDILTFYLQRELGTADNMDIRAARAVTDML